MLANVSQGFTPRDLQLWVQRVLLKATANARKKNALILPTWADFMRNYPAHMTVITGRKAPAAEVGATFEPAKVGLAFWGLAGLADVHDAVLFATTFAPVSFEEKSTLRTFRSSSLRCDLARTDLLRHCPLPL